MNAGKGIVRERRVARRRGARARRSVPVNPIPNPNPNPNQAPQMSLKEVCANLDSVNFCLGVFIVVPFTRVYCRTYGKAVCGGGRGQ